MHGLHIPAGDWMVMLHGYAWGAYTDRGGPRGDRRTRSSRSMAMVTASGAVAPGCGSGSRRCSAIEPLE